MNPTLHPAICDLGAERDGVGPAGSAPTQMGAEVGDEQREGSEQQ